MARLHKKHVSNPYSHGYWGGGQVQKQFICQELHELSRSTQKSCATPPTSHVVVGRASGSK